LVANLVEADLLILLTDQQGLFEHDPRFDPDAGLIAEARVTDPLLDEVAGDSISGLGRGGMITKIRAARLAARSGTGTLIVGGRVPLVLERTAAGEPLGTLIIPTQEPEAARKRWLAGHLQVHGRLVLDAGAVRVLRDSGKSLLPVGVVRVEGRFSRGEVVSCVEESGREVARGLVNYGAEDAGRIAGLPSARIAEVLGYVDDVELIHRDNLVLV
jgi:glutamate 5-kinase